MRIELSPWEWVVAIIDMMLMKSKLVLYIIITGLVVALTFVFGNIALWMSGAIIVVVFLLVRGFVSLCKRFALCGESEEDQLFITDLKKSISGEESSS
ncbi:MAG: hypothetical protein V1690_03000 [Candidatus Moraniibacteriota bacterium]